jgi:hypothetical protein
MSRGHSPPPPDGSLGGVVARALPPTPKATASEAMSAAFVAVPLFRVIQSLH